MWQWCFLLLLVLAVCGIFSSFFLTPWDSLIWYFENYLQWNLALSGVVTESCSFFHFWITCHLLKVAFQSPLHFPIIVFWGLSAAQFYQFVSLTALSIITPLLPRSCLNTLSSGSLTQIPWNSTLLGTLFLLTRYFLYFHWSWVHRRIFLLTPKLILFKKITSDFWLPYKPFWNPSSPCFVLDHFFFIHVHPAKSQL